MTALLAAAALGLAAPQPPTPAAAELAAPYVIPRTTIATLTAPDGTPYRLLVGWPEGEPPAAGWPVLYVLDGADTFAPLIETARRLARGRRGGIAPGIVVGIDSGPLARRVLDYTPAVPGYAIPAGLPAHGLPTGGADAFLDVLTADVLPWVAARWKVDPRRLALAGHSFGGLLALHAAATRPGRFAAYAAISPSLWFGNGAIPRAATAIPGGTRLLLAAGTDERGPAAPAVLPALADAIRTRGSSVRLTMLTGQDHGTTMLAATGAILQHAFGDPS